MGTMTESSMLTDAIEKNVRALWEKLPQIDANIAVSRTRPVVTEQTFISSVSVSDVVRHISNVIPTLVNLRRRTSIMMHNGVSRRVEAECW